MFVWFGILVNFQTGMAWLIDLNRHCLDGAPAVSLELERF